MDTAPEMQQQCNCLFLPLNGLVQYDAVCGIIGSEGGAAILYAKHYQRFGAGVAYGALSVWRHTDNAPLTYGNVLPVHLILSMAGNEKIQLLVVLVRVIESALAARLKHLKGKLAAGGAQGRSAKHLARYFNIGGKRKLILSELTHLANVYGCKIVPCCNFLNLFHFFLSFGVKRSFFVVQSYCAFAVYARRHQRVLWLPAGNYC